MTQLTERTLQTPAPRTQLRRYALIAAVAALTLLIAIASFFTGLSRSQANPRTTPSSSRAATSQCATVKSPWTPVGPQWSLTVQFLSGSRAGQSELSLMTFASDGTLTATFPGATPSAPPTLPAAVDGQWCMTAPNAFHYQFRDVIKAGGQVVAYIQTQINATMTSASSYAAGGVGVGYAAKSGQPLPGQYGLTQTLATVASKG